jgi:hypothetical protein
MLIHEITALRRSEVDMFRSSFTLHIHTRRQLKKELETLKVANSKLKKQLKFEKVHEEEKGILQTRNQEMQQLLEALKITNSML